MTASAAFESGSCDSCGDTTDDLRTVRRLYVPADTPPPDADHVVASADDASLRRAEDLERWCSACRTMYPHEAEAPADET